MRATLLLTLAWRNLWRHTRRTVLIVIAVALGVWSMVILAALARGSMEQQIRNEILNLTGHVQIHAPGYRDDPVIDHRMVPPSPALRAALDDPAVTAWATRVRVPAVVASERESAGVALVGIDPEGERGLSFIPGAVVEGRYLAPDDGAGLLIGRKLAERLETGLGRRVVIMSQDVDNAIADRGFRVVGVFDTDAPGAETAFVFVTRAAAQAMLKLGEQVSELAVMTTDRRRLDALTARLKAAAPGLDVASWAEAQPLLVVTASITEVVLYIWFAIVFLAMSFGLVNTLLMAVFERTREIGLIQALGMQPRQVLVQVLLESLLLLAVGLAIGNALAWGHLAWIRDGIDLSAFAEGMEMVGVSAVLIPQVEARDVLGANLLVLVLGSIASLYPAWRAARYVPVEALTRV
ncbi:MAG TPA: ABC transporter permease [Acidiferrobacterales bacterium]|jgi:ABC-type lipoprotein release transport system permease subunit